MRRRRLILVVSAFLVAASIVVFLSLHLSETPTPSGMVERLDGQTSDAPLLLPLVLFLVGASGFLFALDWKPRERDDRRL